ncbi:MAG TPA: type VI secretion system protein TssA [Acidobacteriaceae bacterium]|nr:type VI secretion system protein TssA [Acidobacteriaceae bacterium]
MPLRDDLLNPIAGENPSGVSLRYDRVSDQIKEARTEGDASILGNLATPKRADYKLVIKLAGEALATKSKDLQFAAWLTEAHVKLEGIGMIEPCLKLMLDLQQQFWETLYPEIEDGDAGMRAVPVEWSANRIADILREAPITKEGLNFYQYRESRTVGYEADAESSDSKRTAREQAIADGKVTAEEFDKSFAATSKAWYVAMEEAIRASKETLDTLQVFCEEKFGDDGPGFGKLHTSLDEVGQVVTSLLNEKRKLEPDAPEPEEEQPQEEPEPETVAAAETETAAESAPAPRKKTGGALPAEPVDREDAIARIQSCAKFLQNENPSNPVAYLVQASLRLGELREQGSSPAWDFLVPPATEQRQNLKRLAAEGNWGELLNLAVAVAGQPCGRGWLDVHRYIWNASNEMGYYAVAASVIAAVRSLLADVPEVPSWTMSDDTPTANPDTQRWLEEMVIPKPPEPAPSQEAPAEPVPAIYAPAAQGQQNGTEPVEPDLLELAKDLMSRGHLNQAVQLLMRDAAQQPSGRARFQRRLQIAQMCAAAGQNKVAYPVLEELVKEIDDRRLEEWEAADMIAPPLALLLRYLDEAGNQSMRDAVFSRLCRIDPIAAMDVSR